MKTSPPDPANAVLKAPFDLMEGDRVLPHPFLGLLRARLLVLSPRLPERHVMSPDFTLSIRAAHPVHDTPEEAKIVSAVGVTTRRQPPHRQRQQPTNPPENKKIKGKTH